MRRLTALLTLIIVLSAAGSAHAAPSWLQPVTLSNTSQEATDTEVAMDPNGNVVAVWSRSNGANTIVQAAYRPAGGSFGPVQNLSAVGANASFPTVDIDVSGNAVAVWVRAGVVQMAGRPAGGSFGSPENVSDASVTSNAPDIEVAANGTAIATWIRGGFAQAIVRQPNGSLGAPQTLSGAGARFFEPCCRADIAMNARGDAVVSWDETDSEVRAVYRPAGGSFSAAPGQLLSSDAIATGSAIDPSGNATVVWTNNSVNAIQGSFRAAGAATTFNPADTIPGSTGGVVPTVAMDSEGTAIALWITGSTFVVQTATRRLNQAFTPAQNITPSGLQAVYPMVVVDGQDGVLATWRRIPDGGGGTYLIQGASRSKNGPFDVRNVSQSGVPFFSRPSIDADARGNGVVGWHRHNGTRNISQLAGFDASPPNLSISGPLAGTTGQGLGFSASTSDVWSAVSTSWDFGDGGGGGGNSVSHAFGAPGTYTVRATATDAVGNSTSTTRAVQITIPPPPPGGGGGGGGSTPQLIPSTVTNNWLAFPKFTKATNLSVNNLLASSTVRVTCKTKKKKQQKKGCAYKSKRFTTSGARAKLNLLKPFRKKKIPVGTRIEITVTVPGQIGKRFRYTMRKRKIPAKQLRCIPPGGKAGSCA